MQRFRLRLPITVALLLMGLVLIVSTSAAWAHPGPTVIADAPADLVTVPPTATARDAVPAAQPPAPATLWFGIALAVTLGVMLAAPRRGPVAILAVLLAVLAIETGVHSVHHLADLQAASQCAVASASAHVHGAAGPIAPDGMLIAVPVGTVASFDVDRPGSRFIRPDEGRAPPTA